MASPIATNDQAEAAVSAQLNSLAADNGPVKLAKSPFLGVFLAADAPAAIALTDSGRELPLFYYEVALTIRKDEYVDPQSRQQRETLLLSAEQHFLQNVNSDERQLVRVSGPELGVNCHGWVFLDGRIGVKDEHIASVLRDNGYQSVDQPAVGDLAIYQEDEKVIHSGVVVSSDGSPQVESKWGPFSVFRHAADGYFRGVCGFWRSPRPGHSLRLQTRAAANAVGK